MRLAMKSDKIHDDDNISKKIAHDTAITPTLLHVQQDKQSDLFLKQYHISIKKERTHYQHKHMSFCTTEGQRMTMLERR